jgi:DoxX-like family
MKTTSIYATQAMLGVVAMAAGVATLAGTEIMVHQFQVIGLGPSFRMAVGALELIAGLSLFVPRTGVFGALLLAGVMVGTMGATVGNLATQRVAPAAAPHLSVSKTYEAGFVRPAIEAAPAQFRSL